MTLFVKSKLSLLVLVIFTYLPEGLFAQSEENYQQIDVLHYTFRLEVSDAHNRIEATADILFKTRSRALETTYFDLIAFDAESKTGMKVSEVKLNDKVINFEQKADRLYLHVSPGLKSGEIGTFNVSYEGVPEDGLIISENEYGERTFFGDNWPNRARHWLPTHDHPSDKATCEFIIITPAQYKVIANGTLREESMLSYRGEEARKLTHWVMAQPIPTKVMVFGAARFAVLYDQAVQDIPIQHWVYADNRDSGFQDFEQTANILQYFIDRIGDYPYDKLANVESKTRYGGMENASNIFYNEQAVDGTQSIEALIAHEVAHQWFGNSISEKEWKDIWLSEGFATYMSHTYLEKTYGEDTLAAVLKEDKEKVFSYYQRVPESTVVDDSQENIYLLLNANSYQKGAWFLHMLRLKIGDLTFWKGIKSYYRKYGHTKANTQDFKNMMESLSGESLEAFFDLWLYSPGHPILKGDWKYSVMGKKLKISLEQVQENDKIYDLPLEVAIYYKAGTEPTIEKIRLDTRSARFTLKLKARPLKVEFDPRARVLVDTKLIKPQAGQVR